MVALVWFIDRWFFCLSSFVNIYFFSKIVLLNCLLFGLWFFFSGQKLSLKERKILLFASSFFAACSLSKVSSHPSFFASHYNVRNCSCGQSSLKEKPKQTACSNIHINEPFKIVFMNPMPRLLLLIFTWLNKWHSNISPQSSTSWNMRLTMPLSLQEVFSRLTWGS